MNFRVRRLLCGAFLALSACAAARGGRIPDQVPLIAPPVARHAVTTLVLTEAGPEEGQHTGYFDAAGAGRVSLGFVAHGPMHYAIRATCDGRARVRYEDNGAVTTLAWTAAGEPVPLRIEPGERDETWLDLDPATASCDLQVTPGGRPGWALHLEREDHAQPRLAALDAPIEACTSGGEGPLQRAMMDSGTLSVTCPMPAGPMRFLPDGVDALNARVEALTGRPLSRAALESGDPDMPLDFSHAPHLDLIYLNYLNVNADFAGALTARMLAWHAARGTVVRILISDIMLTEVDRRLFEGLAARYPTVEIQLYRMPAETAVGAEGQFARLHRITHVKLFATVAREPGRSMAMIGGRNIHEGYFFREPRDLSDFPQLQQYDPEDIRIAGGFTAYDDFELAFTGDAQVRRIVRQMGALWHRDQDTQSMLPPSGTRAPVGALAEGSMRSFVSVPFADGAAMDGWFARMIDAARHRIRIASPYLNLTPEIEAAFQRARARGVEVDVVATVRVREATDFMVTGFNRRFANRDGDWMRFYDYDPYPLLMHTKLIVIDDHLVIAGSVNLNQRSFWHDLENGAVILDRGLAAQADALIQSYIDRGERVPTGQVMSRWMRYFARFGFIERAF